MAEDTLSAVAEAEVRGVVEWRESGKSEKRKRKDGESRIRRGVHGCDGDSGDGGDGGTFLSLPGNG